MQVPLRRFISALAIVAALWLAAGSAVASFVGCCAEQQDCCVLAAVPSPCSACVPGLAPIGHVVTAHGSQGGGAEPAYEPVAEWAAPGPSIWRPPDEKLVEPQNSTQQL